MYKIIHKYHLGLFPSFLLTLTLFFTHKTSGLYIQNNVNDTCVLEKLDELKAEASSKFRFLSELSQIMSKARNTELLSTFVALTNH